MESEQQVVIDDQDAKANIAANVTFLLKERDWSQRKLATITHETRMMICRICRAEHLPNAATIARIAEALHTSVDWLLSDHGNQGRKTA